MGSWSQILAWSYLAFHAPPGYYMLFVLRHSINEQNPSDVQLVPSIGKYVKVVGPIIN